MMTRYTCKNERTPWIENVDDRTALLFISSAIIFELLLTVITYAFLPCACVCAPMLALYSALFLAAWAVIFHRINTKARKASKENVNDTHADP